MRRIEVGNGQVVMGQELASVNSYVMATNLACEVTVKWYQICIAPTRCSTRPILVPFQANETASFNLRNLVLR